MIKTLLVFAVMCTPAVALAQASIPVRWDWMVVSTPDFVGPFRGSDPGFEAPVPKEPLPARLALARKLPLAGIFEAIVTIDGATLFEKTLKASSPEIERRVKEAVRKWRFTPARLDGKLIRVRVRIFLESA